MGQPAEPTASERTERLVLARAIVDAVRNDEPGPLDPPEAFETALAGSLSRAQVIRRSECRAWAERVDLVLFSLAQELTILTNELDESRKVRLELARQAIDAEKRTAEQIATWLESPCPCDYEDCAERYATLAKAVRAGEWRDG